MHLARRATSLVAPLRHYFHSSFAPHRPLPAVLCRLFSTAESADADYYRILGVSRDADAVAIKAGFHAAAKRYHPDVHGEGGAELFKRVNEAYTVLSEPDSRRAYDAGRYATRPSNAAAPQASTTTLRERNEGTFGGVGPVDPESADAFREAMHRSAARVKDGARMRASLSRLQRAQVDVPPVGTVSAKFALPFIAAGIWVVNWALFMR